MKTTFARATYAFFIAGAVGAVVLSVFLVNALLNPGVVDAQTAAAAIPLCEIQRSLTIGSEGEDVRCLQRYLNFSGHTIASSGVGSPGEETSYFGTLTADAVARWQNANAAAVLTPVGLTTGSGYWGPSSFAHYVALVRTALGVSS